VQVWATTDRDALVQAIGASLSGGVSAGAAVAIALLDGWTHAFVGDVEIGQALPATVGGLDVKADSKTFAEAMAIAVSAGLYLGLSGAVALAFLTPSVQTWINGGASIDVDDDVSLKSLSQADADVDAIGVNVGAAALGASVAIAKITPTVSTTVGASVTIVAGQNVVLQARHNYDELDNRLDQGANAMAACGSGGLVVGAAGAYAEAESTTDLETSIASSSTVTATNGDVRLISKASEVAEADATGAAIGILGVGVSLAFATIGEADGSGVPLTTTKASIGDSTIHAGGDVEVISHTYADASAETIAASAGILSGQGNYAEAEINRDVDATIATGATVTAGGDVTVRSYLEANAYSDSLGVSVGYYGQVGVSLANSSITSTVDTYIGGATVTAGGNVTVESLHNFDTGGNALKNDDDTLKGAYASANASGGGVFVGGNGADVDATVKPTINTYVGGTGLDLNADGAVSIVTRSSHQTQAEAFGISIGGVVGVGAILADAVSDGTLTTRVGAASGSSGGGVNFTAGSLNVETQVLDAAYSEAEGGTGSLGVAVGVGEATSQGLSDASAYVNDVDVISVDGDVSIRATLAPDLFAKAYGVNIAGLVSVGCSDAEAIGNATVTAFLNAADFTAGSLTISAAQVLPADGESAGTESSAMGGSLIVGVNAADSKAENTAVVTSYIADNSTLTVLGTTQVIATSEVNQLAEGSGKTYFGGIVAVGAATAEATSSATTTAYVGQNVSLRGGLLFDPSLDVDNANNTIDLGFDHGLVNGQAIVYDSGGADAISGLLNGRTYYVRNSQLFTPLVSVDGDVVYFSPTYAMAAGDSFSEPRDYIPGMDNAADTITFSDPHGLITGDAVIYEKPLLSDGSVDPAYADITNLTHGQTYYVVVVDAETIQLAPTYADATATTPTVVNFTSSIAFDFSDATTWQFYGLRNLNTIDFFYDHGYQTGDRVIYDSGGDTDLGGLTSGDGYYVVRVDAQSIKLAASYDDAIAAVPVVVSLSATGITGSEHSLRSPTKLQLGLLRSDVIGQTPVVIDLDASYATGDEHRLSPVSVVEGGLIFDPTNIVGDVIDLGIEHHLVNGQALIYDSGEFTPVGGLMQGGVYYVVVESPTTIKLNKRSVINVEAIVDSVISMPDHGFTSGEPVVYQNSPAGDIGGLTNGATYYVVVQDANSIKLATDAALTTIVTLDPTDVIAFGTHAFTETLHALFSLAHLDGSVATGTEHRLKAVSSNNTDQLAPGALIISASGSDQNKADTIAGKGFSLGASFAAADSTTSTTSTTTAEIRGNTANDTIRVNSLYILADHQATFNHHADGTAIALFGAGSYPSGENTVTSDVSASVGGGVDVKAGTIVITATNQANKPKIDEDPDLDYEENVKSIGGACQCRRYDHHHRHGGGRRRGQCQAAAGGGQPQRRSVPVGSPSQDRGLRSHRSRCRIPIAVRQHRLDHRRRDGLRSEHRRCHTR
jgi:hypothetical protein